MFRINQECRRGQLPSLHALTTMLTVAVAMEIGADAFALLKDVEFLREWLALYNRCNWATAFQSPEFCLAWYETYSEEYRPVLVMGRDAGGLMGILPLAITADRSRLVPAGAVHAEYQGWLENPGNDNRFIRKAMPFVRKEFPGTDLYFKYLPAGTPIDWIEDDPALANSSIVREYPRPLMEIDEKVLVEKMNSKPIRKKISKLKQLGAVNFEHVVDDEKLVRLFDEIPVQYDFRNYAMYGVDPFAEDPLKKPFHIALHRCGLLHTTCLKVGEDVISTKSGLIGKGCLHATLRTHLPQYARYSPGTLHTLFLGLQLAKENIPIYDLTPSIDEFKQSFTTHQDKVVELSIYGNLGKLIKREGWIAGREVVKYSLNRAGWKASNARIVFERWKLIRRAGYWSSGLSLARKRRTPGRLYCYSSRLPDRDVPHIRIAKNSLSDLLNVNAPELGISRLEFLKTSMSRLADQDQSYTCRENGATILCCWVKTENPEAAPSSNQDDVGASRSFLLYDLYVHEDLHAIGQLQDFLEYILRDLKYLPEVDIVFCSGDFNKLTAAAIEQFGFVWKSDCNDVRQDVWRILLKGRSS